MSSMNRRDFLSRVLGNGLLALGGSLFGSAVAYTVYRQRATDSLADLKAGVPLKPPVQAALPAATARTAKPAPRPAAPSSQGATDSQAAPTPADDDGSSASAASDSAQAADVSQESPPGLVPVKMQIESIGLLNAKVVTVGTKIDKGEVVWEAADHAVGYLSGTGLPGRPGNLVFGGHISSPVSKQGDIFHSLPNLKNKLNSRVTVQTADGSVFVYTITGTDVVLPSDAWVMDPTPKPTLTLVTCVPDGVYTHRFIAHGEFAGQA
jgi:LPXTG-site transpeptidase (sortase) family protein